MDRRRKAKTNPSPAMEIKEINEGKVRKKVGQRSFKRSDQL